MDRSGHSLAYRMLGHPWGSTDGHRRLQWRRGTRCLMLGRFGKSCHQVDTSLPSKVREMLLKVPSPPSEDCLNLNIYAPTTDRMTQRSLLPVIFFIHGGCFSSGANSCPVYNATDVVNSFNAVVVVPNYRLNVFGFLASEDIAREASGREGMGKSFGNYAILDVIEALRWVHSNIEAFGGNPNLVTVMGQSAGAHHGELPSNRIVWGCLQG